MLNRTLLISLMALIASMTLSAPIAAENYVEGVHYEAIDIPVKTGLEGEQPLKVEVVEVFSYMCIHCYSFDPLLKLWEQGKAEQGNRKSDEVYGGMMRGVSKGLSDREIAVLSDYISGLN